MAMNEGASPKSPAVSGVGEAAVVKVVGRLAWILLNEVHLQTEDPAMGIFSRFTDIVNANINSILDKAEDPEKLVRLMIQEMEDTLVEVRSTAARAIADRKEITRTLTGLETESRDWQSKAELALDKEREDLAKAALAEKARVVNAADALRSQHQSLGDGLERLNEDIVRLEEKMVDAKTRQQAILARQQTASRRLEVRKRLHSARIDDAFIKFDQFERRVDDMEAYVEAYDMGSKTKKGLQDEFADLEAEDAVAKELRELKSKRAGQKSGGNTPV
jgi:phage shock protein A